MDTESPAAWSIEQFRDVVVEVNPGYRRCEHVENGFRCVNTYHGGRGTHAMCARHRGEAPKRACRECGAEYKGPNGQMYCEAHRTVENVCEQCGERFVVARMRKEQRYCSTECRKLGWAESFRRAMAKKKAV